MESTYRNLIDQTFEFPQGGFEVKDNRLHFHDIDLMEIIEKFGTPLKLNYLPKISEQIRNAKTYFASAIKKYDYRGTYTYCYCTKSSHFSFVLNEALKNDIHLETSSAFDIHIIRKLFDQKQITKDTYIVHNGYKPELYISLISKLINDGFNSIPVLDNANELEHLRSLVNTDCNVGIRIATGEEPRSNYYTSRLGIRHREILDFYKNVLIKEQNYKLKMLHFFIDSGMEDSVYYWNELQKCLKVYCDLKQECDTLDTLNIGGGLPVKTSLSDTFDHQNMVDSIVRQIKEYCDEREVLVPNIFSEFGSYTVAESGATLYSIIDQKKQNDVECWNMIDSSFITTLPDSWGTDQRFILLAINRWDSLYEGVNLGGLTCDGQDHYNVETHANNIYLPQYDPEKSLYIGFFNTGAYQNELGGYGGIQHCLVPSPKQIIIYKDGSGKVVSELFSDEQCPDSMMGILGY